MEPNYNIWLLSVNNYHGHLGQINITKRYATQVTLADVNALVNIIPPISSSTLLNNIQFETASAICWQHMMSKNSFLGSKLFQQILTAKASLNNFT